MGEDPAMNSLKKWEVTLQLTGTLRTISITDLTAPTSGEAVGLALSYLAMPAQWHVQCVAEIVSV